MKMLELPGDLVEEILCRVPATSVKHLQSTCKQWNRLFNDKRIIRKHCDKAAKQFMVLLLTNSFTIIPVRINLNGTLSVKRKREVYKNSNQFHIYQVFHCEGLLLCTSDDEESTFMVWNPFTNQSRWIQFNKRYMGRSNFFLGYSQDNKSCNKSYKVLIFDHIGMSDVAIYELNSDSCRSIDNDNHPGRPHIDQTVSLKGNSYWFDIDETKMHLGIFLNKFDFSTEKLGRRVLLPYQCQVYVNKSVSVVKEEKLSVSLQRGITSKTEIWVTNQIDETKAVSWSKVLVLDLSHQIMDFESLSHQIMDFESFLLDEEKKMVCCERWYDPEDYNNAKEIIYIVGEDSKVTQLDFGVDKIDPCRQAILNYTPTLVQI